MDKKSLRKLSKNQLIQIILEQQEQYHKLEQRLEQLERLLKSFDNPHTPSSKKRKNNTNKDEGKPRFPGKPKGGNGGGIKLPTPDKIVEHTLDTCPDCDTKLGEPIRKRKRTIIDLPDKLAITTEHQILTYCCHKCNEFVTPRIRFPKGIYGFRIQSLIMLLKNSTLSHQKVSQCLQDLGFPTLSAPTTLNVIQRLVQKLKGVQQGFLSTLRNAPYVHADETGLRKDGKNGYVWGVFTDVIAVLSAELSRARKHIKNLLPNFKGVVVTDGYNAYNEFELRQRCWVHLIRDAKAYAEKDTEIEIQYQRLKALYERLKVLNKEPPDEQSITRVKWELQDIVTCLKTIQQGRKLATLIENGGDNWFTALYHEGVPLDNNHAERGLRHIVLHRKVVGCYRNEKGKEWIDVGISVLQSWRLQGKNPYQELCAIASLT